MPGEYVYTVWFRDTNVLPEDEDYEWPACIIILADSVEAAQSWGDHLAKNYSVRIESEIYLKSEVLTRDDPFYADVISWENVPIVVYGEEASDEKIGW